MFSFQFYTTRTSQFLPPSPTPKPNTTSTPHPPQVSPQNFFCVWKVKKYHFIGIIPGKIQLEASNYAFVLSPLEHFHFHIFPIRTYFIAINFNWCFINIEVKFMALIGPCNKITEFLEQDFCYFILQFGETIRWCWPFLTLGKAKS